MLTLEKRFGTAARRLACTLPLTRRLACTLPLTRRLACILPLAGLLACASSGGAPAPERITALAVFAGDWEFDEAATAQAADLPGTRPQDHLSQRASDLGMEMMRERGAGADAVSGTPAGLRQTMLMVGVTPESLTFRPGGTDLSVTFDTEDPISLPLDGSWVESSVPQGTVDARLRWRGDDFAIERRIPGGGTIRDACSILESGHLLVTREIVWRRARPVGLIVYRRR